MKYIILLFISLSYSQIFAQVSEQDLSKIKSQVETEATALKKSLGKKTSDPLLVEFQIDTFKIERLLKLKMDLDYSTLGMREATNEAEEAYDLLLNKYYKFLLNKLEANDKAILQEAQRNWIKFRDSEFALVNLMDDEKYSDGGTIQQVINSATYFGITKQRLIELKNHLFRN